MILLSMKKKIPSQYAIGKLWFKIVILLVVSIVFVMSCAKVYPTTETQMGLPLERFALYLDARISQIMEAYDIPGANIALVQDGEIIWAQAYGYADLSTGRAMTTDTPLRVESISKSVTAWGIMRLVEEGKLELDRPVVQYLKSWTFPTSDFAEENITVRQLLSHSAGLPLGDFTKRYSPEMDPPSLEECLSTESVLEREPGVLFSYSNVGFNLLELLIQEVSGRDFSEYMEQEVLIPLGMNHSSFTWGSEFDPAVPFGYDLTSRPVPVYIYPEKGSGGLFSTVEDVAIFVAAGMPNFSRNDQVLREQNINMLYTPVMQELGLYSYVFDSYGLGYYIENLSNGNRAVSHGGQGAGWMTHFHSIPETGDGIVILTNSQRSWPFIAYILNDWTSWNGSASVGMSGIIWAIYGLWITIGLILFTALWQLWSLVEALASKQADFALRHRHSRFVCATQIGTAGLLIIGLLWCMCQDYLFISSVFPIASKWLGFSLFLLALALLLSALFSKEKVSC